MSSCPEEASAWVVSVYYSESTTVFFVYAENLVHNEKVSFFASNIPNDCV